jgi:hypothetical protein
MLGGNVDQQRIKGTLRDRAGNDMLSGGEDAALQQYTIIVAALIIVASTLWSI